MNWEDLQQYLIGGGGLIALISWYGTHKGNSKQSRLDLVDRLYKEIERMDEKVNELEADLKLKDETISNQNALIFELRESMEAMRESINELKGGR